MRLSFLHRLLEDWQVIADLAAADLVLWLPTDDDRFIAVESCRPSTSVTVHAEDPRGLYLPLARELSFVAPWKPVKSFGQLQRTGLAPIR